MKSIKSFLLNTIIRMINRLGWHSPITWVLKSAISEHPDNRKISGRKRTTILALSPEGFRGDLEALARSGRCRILLLNSIWQYRFLQVFYRKGIRTRDILNPPSESPDVHAKAALQEFYLAVLPSLYEIYKIDCVISYHLRVPSDTDWGIVSRKLGVPFIIFYREGLFASSPYLRKRMKKRFDWFGFWGTHLVVHNDSCRQLCIETGLVTPEKISALGCIRMDNYLQRIRERKNIQQKKKRVALFPVVLSVDQKRDAVMDSFFNDVHIELARLAARHPDVEFVFKPKPKDYRSWRKLVDEAFLDAGIDCNNLPNLIMDGSLDAQKLILNSTVICGINSTTLLEAAIAERPVVIPYFEKLRNEPYSDMIKFVEAFQFLDVADKPESFSRLIEKRLSDNEISAEQLAGRRKMFARYVSDPDGGALEQYITLIEQCVSEASSKYKKFFRQPEAVSENLETGHPQ